MIKKLTQELIECETEKPKTDAQITFIMIGKVDEIVEGVNKLMDNTGILKAEAKIAKLQKALSDLIGASGRAELEQMELALRTAPSPEADKIAAINAIHVLLKTL